MSDNRFIKFDIDQVVPESTTLRKSLIDISKASILCPKTGQINVPVQTIDTEEVADTIFRIQQARKADCPVILCMGAHSIKNGCGTLINSLIEHGFITHVATNGAAAIHDTEFATFGKSTESVRENLADGTFGIWRDIGAIFNNAFEIALFFDWPFGNALGNISCSHAYPYKSYSVAYACYTHGVPFTVHPALGQDIVYTNPKLNWKNLCEAARNDFLYFSESVRNLNGGVFLSVGSSVMSPMIFEKALSMARHVEHKNKRSIENFTITVNDLIPNPTFNWNSGKEPPMDDPAYYMRFMKSFSRAGGKLNYICVDNRNFWYSLWKGLVS